MANAWQIEQEEGLKDLQNYHALEYLRKQGIYVWAFPITYPDKITFGWEYELPDGRTSWYSEELPTYSEAMTEGIKQASDFEKRLDKS